MELSQLLEKKKERVCEKQIITYFRAKKQMKNKLRSATGKTYELTLSTLISSKPYPGNTDGCAGHQLIPDGMQEPAHFPVLQQ